MKMYDKPSKSRIIYDKEGHTPIFEYFSTRVPNAPLCVPPKLLLSRTRRSKTLVTNPSNVFRPISSPVMVPILAPSRAASVSSAELRIDNAPTYDRRETNRARASGRIVAPAFIMSAFELAFAGATEFACDCEISISDGILKRYTRSRLSSRPGAAIDNKVDLNTYRFGSRI
jgi:hypothetical protein